MSDKWILKMLKENPSVSTYAELDIIHKKEQERLLDRRNEWMNM